MTIVSYVHKPKRPPKRGAQIVAISDRILGVKAQQPAAPVTDEPVIERKPAQPAALTGSRIVTAKKPRPRSGIGPEQIAAAMRDPVPSDPPPATRKSAIVTARSPKAGRFGPVQEIDAEEHQRRGDAAVELFRELVRRAARNAGA